MNYSRPVFWPFSVAAEPGDATLLVVGDTNILDRDDACSVFARVCSRRLMMPVVSSDKWKGF